jgi:hypothetical protein
MALSFGAVRGAARGALVPDRSRRRRLVLPLPATPFACLDRCGHWRREPVLHRGHVPARLADRRAVRRHRNRPSRTCSRRNGSPGSWPASRSAPRSGCSAKRTVWSARCSGW